MKKIVFYLAALLLILSENAFSQEMLANMYLSSPIQKTMIRNHASWGHISYVETSTEHIFVLTYSSMDNKYVVPIPINYFVNDIEIYEDKVFFCGYNSATPRRALLGYFRIDSLCILGGNIFVYDNFTYSPPTTRLKEFSELEVFDEYENTRLAGDSVSIVLVGVNANNRSVIVEATGAYNSPNTWRYALGTNPVTGLNEKVEQISVTDNYIVSGGTIHDKVSGVCFRIFNRHGLYDMFAASTLYNDAYWYPTINPQTNNTTQYPLQTFQMTAMPNDRVATASLYKKYSSGYQPQNLGGFLLNVYSIPQTINTPNTTCLYSIFDAPVNGISSTGTAHVKDLRYDNTTNKFFALLKTDLVNATPYFNECVCTVIPYPQIVPYSFPYYYITSANFDRVVLCNSGTQCLFSGSASLINTVAYYKNSTTPLARCCTMGVRQFTAPEEFRSKSHNYPLSVYRNTFNYTSFNPTCTLYNMSINCTSKNEDIEK